MLVSDRIRSLVSHSHLLSDWCLACCFNLAKQARIKLNIPIILTNLRHPTGFVREASLAYISVAATNVMDKILLQMKNDPDPLVSGLVQKLMNSSPNNCETIHNL